MHIVITGASSGIGASLVRALGGEGRRLTLVARREAALQALAGEVAAECFVRPADLSDPAAFTAALDDAEAKHGPVDVLINNAGVQYVEPTVGVSAERIERLLTVDLTSPLVGIGRVLPSMVERGRGTIVNIASMAGLVPTPGMMHYNAAKAGLGAASESLRAELRGSGVSVMTVYPGPVTTAMEQAARAAYVDSAGVRNVPTGDADELARKIARGIERGTGRIVYPRVYGLARYTRVVSQWVVDRFTPALADERAS